MIIEAVEKLKASRIKQWPVNSNRASNLGHECLRYLVLERTRWQEKKLHDVRLQTIFDEGNLHEAGVLRDLQDAGLTILEQQRAFDWPKYKITGHIDAKIMYSGQAVPIEIKSSSPYSFQSINSVADLYRGKYHYLRRYPSQMTLYLLMDNKDYGFFIFKNKVTGQLKEIRMDLDYELGEKLLQKAETINKHVEVGTLPEHCEYTEDICGDCGYLHICIPDVKRDAIEIKDDPEIEIKLKRLEELKPMKSEYDRIDKQIKETFKEQPKVIINDWIITGKTIERKGYTVAPSCYWQTKIERIGGKVDVE